MPSGPAVVAEALCLGLLLLASSVSAARAGTRPHPGGNQRTLLRPLPSHDLPVIDLVEPAGHVYDPGPEDLDITRLQRTLAGHFDPKFMAVHRPKESFLHPNGSLQPGFRLKKGRLVPARPMPRDLQRIRLKGLDFPGGIKVRLDLGRKLRRKLRQLLWTYTYCPLVYRWKDLGLRFWPRWIREGRCYNSRRSCSFPPGMTCREKTSAEKTVLRWHCRDWTQRRQCRWIPATLSVLVECSCSC
ncbi:noggin-2 [Ixodes scapularis]|nr:noggin-2 [Ixodes scapularis]